MAQPLLLTYNLDPATAAGLRALCRAQDIRVREVKREECALPVGALAGIPVSGAPQAGPGADFDDKMLVMCHMLADQLDAFLRGMRDAGLPRIALKAVLTPVNVTWSSRQLRDELARERAEIVRRFPGP